MRIVYLYVYGSILCCNWCVLFTCIFLCLYESILYLYFCMSMNFLFMCMNIFFGSVSCLLVLFLCMNVFFMCVWIYFFPHLYVSCLVVFFVCIWMYSSCVWIYSLLHFMCLDYFFSLYVYECYLNVYMNLFFSTFVF